MLPTSSAATKPVIDALQKSAFKNKFAETSCESLGLTKDFILNVYKEIEGLVGYINTKRNDESNEKKLNHYAKMIFTDQKQDKSLSYLESVSTTWPKNWFRNVGEKKCQIQIPLSYLQTPNEYYHSSTTEELSKTVSLPPNLQKLSIVFEQLATSYLEDLLLVKNLVPSAFEKGIFVKENENTNNKTNRSQLLAKMKNKSVLRLWIYFGDENSTDNRKEDDENDDDRNTTKTNENLHHQEQQKQEEPCRGHFDPGVVTVLLSGSRKGLQVHKSFVGVNNNNTNEKSQNASYEYATHDANNQAKEDEWINIGYNNNSNNNFSETNIVLMNDTMLQVLTGNVAQHAFHRVIDTIDDENDKPSSSSRIQIVLELRPDNAAKWYGFVPTDEEKKRLVSEYEI